MTTDPNAPSNTFGANAVELAGGTVQDSTVTLPLTGAFAAIGTVGSGGAVRDSAITASEPLNVTDNNLTLSGLRVVGAPNRSAVSVRGTGVELADSTIVQPGSSAAVWASTGNGSDAVVTLDHDTVIGDGTAGSIGLYADAGSPNSKQATITLRDSILRGFARSAIRFVQPAGGASNIVTSYSDFDPSGDGTLGTGGSGAMTIGAGDINAYPAFVNPGGGDYGLTAASPAIDAADPAGLLGGEPSTDLQGAPRIVDSTGGCAPRSDMGALELQAAATKPTAHAALIGTATAGSPASFTGGGSTEPHGKPLTYAWSFGDGGSGTGVAVQHTFTTAGAHGATLTVTDPCGRMDATSISFNVAAAAPPPPPPPHVARPVLSHLLATPSRFRVARGTKLRFTLNEAATVKLTIVRTIRGHRVRTLVTLTATGRRGVNTVRFSGRVHGRALTPGRYRVLATARGSSRAVTTSFTVLARSRRTF